MNLSEVCGVQICLSHTTKSVFAKDVASPDKHGSFADEAPFLIAILYSCLILALSYRKLLYVNTFKYCTL